MTEEKKMLEFLRNKGITTLEQLEAIFKLRQKETAEEEVVFVKEIAGPSISQEKFNLLLEASERNKQKILDAISKTVKAAPAERSEHPEQKKVVQQSTIVADPERVVVPPLAVNFVNAVPATSCLNKNATPLPMRYRHKHTQQNDPYRKQPRSFQQRENNRQASGKLANNKKMSLGVNIQYNHFNQYKQNNQLSNQQSYTANYQGVGHNIAPGYNNATGYSNIAGYNNSTSYNNATSCNNTTGYHNTIGYNNTNCFGTLGHTTVREREPESLLSTPVYNTRPHQQWPTVTPMAHTGQSCYNNFGQFELGSQVQSQQPAQYMMTNRPLFDPN